MKLLNLGPGARGFWNRALHGPASRLRWTCCDGCHAEHVTLRRARLHYWWLALTGRTR